MIKIIKSYDTIYQDRKMLNMYIKIIIDSLYNFENYDLIYKNPITIYYGLHPLPSYFITEGYENIKNENNIYFLKGKTNKKVLFGNTNIPFAPINSIPFTFPIIVKDTIISFAHNKLDNHQTLAKSLMVKKTIELLNSNIYYFEIEILAQHRLSWENESLIIGYSNLTPNLNSSPGTNKHSFCYDFLLGIFLYNTIQKTNLPKGKLGDICGCGIRYVTNNEIEPFYTMNGEIIYKNEIIKYDSVLSPILLINCSNKIKVNFFEFKFNIKKYLHNYYIVSLKNYYIKNNFCMDFYSNDKIVKNKLFIENLKQNNSLSIINETMHFEALFNIIIHLLD